MTAATCVSPPKHGRRCALAMRAFGHNETAARHGHAGRWHELAISLELVVPRHEAEAVERLDATPKPVTTEGGIVRFALSRDAREAA